MKVPIENLYYLLCYAWNVLNPSEGVKRAAENVSTPHDLLARMLGMGLKIIILRGADREYDELTLETYQPAGRFEVHATMQRKYRLIGKVVATEDIYSTDCISNQALVSTIHYLLSDSNLSKIEKENLRKYARLFKSVSIRPLENINFSKIKLHRNNRHYRFPLNVAQFVKENMIFNASSGRYSGVLFSDDMLWRVFQKFVDRFLAREQKFYHVKPQNIHWQEVKGDDHSLTLLPSLQTDICLDSPNHFIVIDTKFYKKTTAHHRRETIHPAHLFQIFGYVQNFSAHQAKRVDGLVIYPTVQKELNARYEIHGNRIHFLSINLNCPWKEIHDSILQAIKSFGVWVT